MNKKPSRYSLLSPRQKARMSESSRLYRSKHKAHIKVFNKRYRLEHKEAIRLQRMEKRYGLSKSDYEKLLLKQGGACAICRGTKWEGSGPHIDHDHASGNVRGILCTRCNTALGQIHDSLATARGLVEYLEQSQLNFGAKP